MDFDEAVEYLLSLGHETLTIKLGLRNTELLFSALQNPERDFPAVQIAGTNGKGSTAVFLDSICRTASINTGLYTSPHLQSITERIRINGTPLSPERFAQHATEVRTIANQLLANGDISALPTFFEQVTAIALTAFRKSGISLAILETGLGGRLDSTTAAKAQICALTQIAFDHEEYLGNSLESIAAEKAAIIRPGVQVVVARQQPEVLAVIMRRCAEVGVRPSVDGCQWKINEVSKDGKFTVTFQTLSATYERVTLGLRGKHQIENAAVAIQLAEKLRDKGFTISNAAIVRGIEATSHNGRLEIIGAGPIFLLDGAHNPAGASALRTFLDDFALRPLTMMFAAMRDKSIEEIAKILFPLADDLILTSIQNPRAAGTETLLSFANEFARGRIMVATTSEEAIKIARKRTPANGMICITGSLYLIGETRDKIAEPNSTYMHPTKNSHDNN